MANSRGASRVKAPGSKKQQVEAVPEPLDPGDTLEFSLTAEVHKGGRSWWVKTGATSTIRPGESVDDATDRVQTFVIDSLNESVSNLID